MIKMTTLLIILGIALCLLVFGVGVQMARASDQDKRAIVESGISVFKTRDALVGAEAWDGKSRGRHGERGRLQWKETTWCQFSSKPFEWAEGRSLAAQLEMEAAEIRYVTWMISALPIINCFAEISPYRVGMLHNAGFGTMTKGRIPRASVDFGHRVANLYYEK